MIDFDEFNKLYNPHDEACYVPLHKGAYGGKLVTQTYGQILSTMSVDLTMELGWVLPKGFLVIETDQDALAQAIVKNKEKVLLYSHNNAGDITYYIFAKSNFQKTLDECYLLCGAKVSTMTYSRQKNVATLPFFDSASVSPYKRQIDILHDGLIDQLPDWLQPCHYIPPTTFEFPIASDFVVSLSTIMRQTRGAYLTPLRRGNLLRYLNDNLVTSPCMQDELLAILEGANQSLITEEFFNEKSQLLHHKMGEYLIRAFGIKRANSSGKMYYFSETDKVYRYDPDYLRSAITRLCPILKEHQRKEVLDYIDAYLAAEKTEFNEDPFTVVFKNGIIDASTMTFESMTPTRLETIQIGAEFDETAYSSTVDKFFKDISCGNADVEELLYEAIGYSMLKTSELQKYFMLEGTGRNGKSTYLDLIKAVLGANNYRALSLKDLSSNFKVAALDNMLASMADDISSQPLKDTDLLKSIAVGEDIEAEQKYERTDRAKRKFFCTLFYSCNNIPKTPDQSNGFYRRMVIIPFKWDATTVTTTGGMLFKRKLLEQEAIDYVATKAIKAIHKVLTTTGEFTNPQVCKDSMRQYKIDNSSILTWCYDETKGKADFVGKKPQDLFSRFGLWCERTRAFQPKESIFKKVVEQEFGLTLDPKGIYI